MSKSRESVKTFLSAHRVGVLSTISRSAASSEISSYPFGSLTPYDLLEDGSFSIFISGLAEHFKNLKADSRASLFVCDALENQDPQAQARATVVGDFIPCPESRLSEVRTSYATRFPDGLTHGAVGDFEFFLCAPKRIRWIGGFGDMCWVDGGDFQ